MVDHLLRGYPVLPACLLLVSYLVMLMTFFKKFKSCIHLLLPWLKLIALIHNILDPGCQVIVKNLQSCFQRRKIVELLADEVMAMDKHFPLMIILYTSPRIFEEACDQLWDVKWLLQI